MQVAGRNVFPEVCKWMQIDANRWLRLANTSPVARYHVEMWRHRREGTLEGAKNLHWLVLRWLTFQQKNRDMSNEQKRGRLATQKKLDEEEGSKSKKFNHVTSSISYRLATVLPKLSMHSLSLSLSLCVHSPVSRCRVPVRCRTFLEGWGFPIAGQLYIPPNDSRLHLNSLWQEQQVDEGILDSWTVRQLPSGFFTHGALENPPFIRDLTVEDLHLRWSQLSLVHINPSFL